MGKLVTHSLVMHDLPYAELMNGCRRTDMLLSVSLPSSPASTPVPSNPPTLLLVTRPPPPTHLVNGYSGDPLAGHDLSRAQLVDGCGHIDMLPQLRVALHQRPELLLAPRLPGVVTLQGQLPLGHL